MRVERYRAVLATLLLPWLVMAGCSEPRFIDDASAPPGSPGDGPVALDPACFEDSSLLGAECPGVVWCTSSGPCSQDANICCVSELTSECSARLNCGIRAQLRCDGAEDCPGEAVCCRREGATVCVENDACEERDRACHGDQDCDLNHCVDGFQGDFAGVPVLFLKGTGFCRGR